MVRKSVVVMKGWEMLEGAGKCWLGKIDFLNNYGLCALDDRCLVS